MADGLALFYLAPEAEPDQWRWPGRGVRRNLPKPTFPEVAEAAPRGAGLCLPRGLPSEAAVVEGSLVLVHLGQMTPGLPSSLDLLCFCPCPGPVR